MLLQKGTISQKQSFPAGSFAGDALAWGVLDVGDFFQFQISGLGGFDDRFGKRMKAGGRQGGAECDGRCFRNSLARGEVGHAWIAFGESSGFVDDEEFDLG